MDVFKVDRALTTSLGRAPSPDKLDLTVSFNGGSEFNLAFFDTQPEDTQGGFSDPGSVGSTSVSSPPPLPSPHLLQPAASTASSTASTASNTVTVKQGQHYHDFIIIIIVHSIFTSLPKYSALILKKGKKIMHSKFWYNFNILN